MINEATVALVKEHEGFRSRAYTDPVGKLTIGWGTTSDASVGLVVTPGLTITREEADRYLRMELDNVARAVRALITVPVNENEIGAFASLAYNIGLGAFSESTALRRFNDGDKGGAAEAIKWWNKGTVDGRKVVLRGLVRRRQAEVDLFNTPVASNWLWDCIRSWLNAA